ncbi:MAG: D-tyrosyl-tRNA(Tyr) deacylase [Ruminococcaceae bacterium]|nr:D-tyrosyl-tRNA(Tyr) deacylase [Oscillospiraceae bacterium]
MRAVLSRVKSASVTVDGQVIGKIGQGFLILLGITHEDTELQAAKLADKLTGLRIFEDEDGKMNRGLETVNGEILVVSQFTLYGNCRKGRRPDFLAAARPEVAIPLYEKFVQLIRDKGIHVETGEFGAEMMVESINDGPLTLIVDTNDLNI